MKEILTFGMAMVPVIELRGAIPFGLAQGLSPWEAFALSVAGNMVPVPFIILLIRRVFAWLARNPRLRSWINALEKKAHLKGRVVGKYRVFGLILLVAVPLPGTGAWTGALVAAILEIRLQNALPAILLGVLIAGAIVLGASCGVIALWF